MAFKMKAGSGGPMRKNFPGAFKQGQTGHVKPRGYDESREGMDRYPEVTKTAVKELNRGWKETTGKDGNKYYSYLGSHVPNPDMSDVYKTKLKEVHHRGGSGVSQKDQETIDAGDGSTVRNVKLKKTLRDAPGTTKKEDE